MVKAVASGLCALVVVVLAVFLFWKFGTPIEAIYILYFRSDSYQQIFYRAFGLDENEAALLSAICVFVYAIATIGFAAFTSLALRAKLDARWVGIGFMSFISVYALVPLAHILVDRFSSPVCFNQADGKSLKWYVVRSGKIVIFDSGGYDPLDGTQKQPATAEICRAFNIQRSGNMPSRIAPEDALQRKEQAWFARVNGELEFYDGGGIRPHSSVLLAPMNDTVYLELKALIERKNREAAAKAAAEQRDAAAKAAAEQRDAEANKKRLEEEAERQVTHDALATLQKLTNMSRTGYECKLEDDGIPLLNESTRQSQLVQFQNIDVEVAQYTWNSTDVTAVAVHRKAIADKGFCFIYAINPSPPAFSNDQKNTVDEAIKALAVLNANIIHRELPQSSLQTTQSPPSSGTQNKPSGFPNLLDGLIKVYVVSPPPLMAPYGYRPMYNPYSGLYR
jgi:hypothetical protein